MPRVRASVKQASGSVALTSIDLPDPGPGQALVRTSLTTICGSDIHIVDHIPEVPAGMPMGHEGIGVVEAVGSGVERFRQGDRVVACCLLSCGSCLRCAAGDPSICMALGAPMNLLFGAQAEAFLVSGADHSLARIPRDVPDRSALAVADILSTGLGAIERAGLTRGQSVAIFAQGPVGLCATLGARFYGAEPIIAVEGIAERARLARKLGATHVVSPEHVVESIMEITGGAGVDVAVEALGTQLTFESCCRVTRLGGTVSSVGVYAGIPSLSLPTDGSFVHRKIVTTFCPAGSARMEFLLDLIRSGRIDPLPLFSHNRSLDSIVDCYDLARSREDGVVKIAISI